MNPESFQPQPKSKESSFYKNLLKKTKLTLGLITATLASLNAHATKTENDQLKIDAMKGQTTASVENKVTIDTSYTLTLDTINGVTYKVVPFDATGKSWKEIKKIFEQNGFDVIDPEQLHMIVGKSSEKLRPGEAVVALKSATVGNVDRKSDPSLSSDFIAETVTVGKGELLYAGSARGEGTYYIAYTEKTPSSDTQNQELASTQ